MGTDLSSPITIYSTCPQSKDVPRAEYPARVAEVARWSEEAGCRGMLVYTDNSLFDPWLVAQHALTATTTLRPLVAVQPVYMHPYAVAKLVTSLAHLHGRAVDLNFVAGGFRNDLRALADDSPHDERYSRIIEYATIVKRLVEDDAPVTFEGRFYRVSSLRLTPVVPVELRPRFLISGSSPAGRDAARAIGAVAVRYPEPPGESGAPRDNGFAHGIRVGIIARENSADAWATARSRFPENRQGELAHALAMKVSDSVWHAQLSGLPDGGPDDADPYWLWPFKSYGTFCPYLVGTYDRLSAEIARYLAAGVRTIITDIPREPGDLHDAQRIAGEALSSLPA